MMDTDNRFDELLQREQVKTLYLQWKSLVSGCAFVVVVTTVTLWNFVDKKLILAWLVANVLFLSLRSYSLLKELKKSRHSSSDIVASQFDRKAISRYRLYSLCNSLLWGTVPLFLFTENFPIFSIALLTHGGYIAAAVSATASYDMKSFYAFVFPASVLWVIGTAINGGAAFFPHIVLFSFYPLIMTVFALRINNSFKEQILLRLENADLNFNLREQRDRAENAMLEKNRFLAAASHDLRQPVHALGLFVASLEPHLSEKEPRMLLGQIKQTTENLGSLFHGLLDLSKLDANVVQNNPEHVFLKPLIDRLAREYRESAEVKGLTISTQCQADLVSHVDLSLLERILRNLFSNAINHTQTGTISLIVSACDSGELRIDCSDTGKGIPQDEHERIFSEYHQLENPERDRKKGLGLGLAIVRRLSELMQLNISVKSESGKGSTFSLFLQSGNRTLVESTPEPVAPTQVDGLSAIVIDDEEDILFGMRSLLSAWGCRVITATSGDSAIQKLDAELAPDVIVADFRLRDHESGLDVIQRIRNKYPSKIMGILVTGDTAAERLQQADLADVEVMHKPVDTDSLKKIFMTLQTAAANTQATYPGKQ